MEAMIKRIVLMGAILALTTGCSSSTDAEKLEGAWLSHAVYGEFYFGPMPKRACQSRLTFSHGNFALDHPGLPEEPRISGTFICDPTTNPKQITFHFDGRTVVAIYDISGGQVRICVGEKDDAPPTKFSRGALGSKSPRPAVLIFDRAPKGE
jgi:uncharacterized protein (TIGR03067 family)